MASWPFDVMIVDCLRTLAQPLLRRDVEAGERLVLDDRLRRVQRIAEEVVRAGELHRGVTADGRRVADADRVGRALVVRDEEEVDADEDAAIARARADLDEVLDLTGIERSDEADALELGLRRDAAFEEEAAADATNANARRAFEQLLQLAVDDFRRARGDVDRPRDLRPVVLDEDEGRRARLAADDEERRAVRADADVDDRGIGDGEVADLLRRDRLRLTDGERELLDALFRARSSATAAGRRLRRRRRP